MGDTFKQIRLAAVQAASVFLDREGSVEKACRLIREAGENGADVIGFPEGFVPAHPSWYDFLPGMSRKALLLSRELFKNAVEVPSPATDRLCEACREANVTAVVGMCEKRPRTTGTMWNTQLFIDRTGEILGKHQKLVPTAGERFVHTGGQGSTLRAVQADFGALSGLLCGENNNPLAAFALAADYTRVHVAAWPAHFGLGALMQDSIRVVTCGLAHQLKCFVMNACGVVTEEMIAAYALNDEDRAYLAQAKEMGAASIIGPRGQFLAGPAEPGEQILYCDVDTQDLIIPKFTHDVAGHYNRFDVFSFAIRPDPRASLYGPRPDRLTGEATMVFNEQIDSLVSVPERGLVETPEVQTGDDRQPPKREAKRGVVSRVQPARQLRTQPASGKRIR